MSTYSNRIRELRKNKSLSQEQLADKLGVTKQAVSQMERGARKPSVTMLEALCDFFNVSTDYLLGKEDVTIRIIDRDGIRKLDSANSEVDRIAKIIRDNPTMHNLFDIARNCTPDNLELIAEVLKRMKQ